MLVDGRWKHLCKLISATMALLERVTVYSECAQYLSRILVGRRNGRYDMMASGERLSFCSNSPGECFDCLCVNTRLIPRTLNRKYNTRPDTEMEYRKMIYKISVNLPYHYVFTFRMIFIWTEIQFKNVNVTSILFLFQLG